MTTGCRRWASSGKTSASTRAPVKTTIAARLSTRAGFRGSAASRLNRIGRGGRPSLGMNPTDPPRRRTRPLLDGRALFALIANACAQHACIWRGVCPPPDVRSTAAAGCMPFLWCMILRRVCIAYALHKLEELNRKFVAFDWYLVRVTGRGEPLPDSRALCELFDRRHEA